MLKISVIIPVYKDTEGLEETLASLMAQTLPASDFEVIVINDGGDPAIVKMEASHPQPNVRYIHRSPNRGSYFSRNEGIQLAEANQLAFTDAGCSAATDWLESGLKHLGHSHYVAGRVAIDYSQVNTVSEFYDYLTAFPVKDYFQQHGFGVTANLFVQKAVFQSAGLFNDTLYSGGDMEFGVRLQESKQFKAHYADDCIVYHPPRNHGQKVEKIKRVRKGQENLLRSKPSQFSFLANRPLSARIKDFLPPSMQSFRQLYNNAPANKNEKFNKLAVYCYMYRLKIIKAFL